MTGRENKVKQELIKRAIVGDNDYHALMRSIAIDTLQEKAGYKPQNTGSMELHKNFVDWISPRYDISLGVHWIFYAVECGHFRPLEAQKVWRYGQALQIFRRNSLKFKGWFINNIHLMDYAKNILLNPYEYVDQFDNGIVSFKYHKVRQELGLEIFGSSVSSQHNNMLSYAIGLPSILLSYVFIGESNYLNDLKDWTSRMEEIFGW